MTAAHFAAHSSLAAAHGPGIFLRTIVGGHCAPIVGVGAVGIQSGVAAAVAGEIQGAAIDGQVCFGINAVSLRSDGESTAVDQNKTVRGSGRGKPILLTHSKAGTVGPTGGIEPIALGGLAAVLILLLLLSKRIVRPVAES